MVNVQLTFTVFALIMLLAVLTVVFSVFLLKRERLRLEKILHDYNKAFEDDYKPF